MRFSCNYKVTDIMKYTNIRFKILTESYYCSLRNSIENLSLNNFNHFEMFLL